MKHTRHLGSKQRNLRTYSSEVFLLLFSAVVFSAAFPGFLSQDGIGILGFVALIPLFAAIRLTSWVATPFYGFLFGFSFYSLFNYWLATFHPLAVYIAPIIMGTEMILLFPIMKAADRLIPKYGWVVQAFIWVGYEYLKTLGFVGYPYGIVGYSQYEFLPFIQISSIFGVWGVSLLTVFPSLVLGRGLADWLRGRRPFIRHVWGEYRPVWGIYAAAVAAALIFGSISMDRVNDETPERVWRVALVQHNADSWKGGLTAYRRNLETLIRLSEESLAERPEAILWSETAFVVSVHWHSNYRTDPAYYALVKEFLDFTKTLDIPLVTGNNDNRLKDPSLPPILSDGSLNREDHNAVIMYEDGELQDIYWKQHLVPFTEHFPYERQLPGFYAMLRANDYHFWEKGDRQVVFETKDGVRFSTPICFEDVFGYLSAEFVQQGADVIVNMTNDSWSGAVSA